ncbi:hypothetical protein CVT25_003361 [Psilocybe cyanescens]|uniref:Uncharacterized protein n=1 Tax=Psilocybe cyanescens TaxID=93625 RepID=A0A409XR02_PSICY|nr:hypothetical protein CVT25_003361 [Psilocybe cyanescens]
MPAFITLVTSPIVPAAPALAPHQTLIQRSPRLLLHQHNLADSQIYMTPVHVYPAASLAPCCKLVCGQGGRRDETGLVSHKKKTLTGREECMNVMDT